MRSPRFASKLIQAPRRLLEWIGQHELSVLMAWFIAMLGAWAFFHVAGLVVAGRSQYFDESVLRVLRRPDDPAIPIGPRWLSEVARDVTALGGSSVLTLITLSVVGFLYMRRMTGAMWLVLASTSSGLVATAAFKWLFQRSRPDVVPALTWVTSYSFPSGHAMLSAVVYLTLGALLGRFVTGRALQAYFLVLAVVLTVSVGASRVFLGVHYPTDVLAGWSMGGAWALACWLIARGLQHQGAVEQPTA